VTAKIAAAVPPPLRQTISARSLHAWGPIAPQPQNVDFTMIRRAIRDEEKLDLTYEDEQGRITQRIIRPLALIYYLDSAVIVGWCELREAIRNFRLDRTQSCKATGIHFRKEGDALRDLWISGWKTKPAA
jgi:predicted DNA-binding transcriptional regulator YafY